MLKLFSSPGRTGGLFPRLKAPTETKTAEITRISAVYWSEWRDLNSRPLDPQWVIGVKNREFYRYVLIGIFKQNKQFQKLYGNPRNDSEHPFVRILF